MGRDACERRVLRTHFRRWVPTQWDKHSDFGELSQDIHVQGNTSDGFRIESANTPGVTIFTSCGLPSLSTGRISYFGRS